MNIHEIKNVTYEVCWEFNLRNPYLESRYNDIDKKRIEELEDFKNPHMCWKCYYYDEHKKCLLLLYTMVKAWNCHRMELLLAASLIQDESCKYYQRLDHTTTKFESILES